MTRRRRPYTVQSIASDTALTLATNYAAANAATSAITALGGGSGDFGVQLSVSSPTTTPSPLPLGIKVFPINAPVPQTATGLASLLQSAINAALAVKMPGASVACSVSAIGTN